MAKTVPEAYDELWHYTTAGGLCGMVSSGALWATSARYLNDVSEVKHFFDVRLPELATQVLRQYADELAAAPKGAKKMKAKGGIAKVVKDEVEGAVARYRSATFEINDPYLFSLSAPFLDKVRSAGLLSQWRGYGGDGGYALVFDPAGLDALLKEEEESFAYQYVQWGDLISKMVQPPEW